MIPIPHPDDRSLLVLVEPQLVPEGIAWHGMAFIRGQAVKDVCGSNREAVFDACVGAISAVLTDASCR